MSEVETTGARRVSSTTGAATDGTTAAIESFAGRKTLKVRYLLLAIGLAVVWWMSIGGLSAWVAAIGLVVLVPAAQGLVAVALSRRWPQTEGVVIESRVLTEPEARDYGGSEATIEKTHDTGEFSGGYVPMVRYAFTADGKRYVNAAISPFDGTVSKRPWAAALVGQYPRNSHMTLRYDPDDPTRSYLRPWIRSTTGHLPVAGIAMLAVAAWFAGGMPGGVPVVPLAIGIPIAGYGFSRLVTGLRSRNWPTSTGTVTATGVQARGGSERRGTGYVPGIEYEYAVDGTTYASTRYALGVKEPAFGSRDEAETWLEDNYPVDGEVTVHYDPDRPGAAVLEPGVAKSVQTLLFGLAFVGAGVFMLAFPEAVDVNPLLQGPSGLAASAGGAITLRRTASSDPV